MGRFLEIGLKVALPNGVEIGTTAEHPFWVVGKGWINAGELQPGDRLIGQNGHESPVLAITETSQYQKVYNFRVSDYHTYFVGGPEWGYDVWAHNHSCAEIGQAAERAARIALRKRGHKIIGSMVNNSGHGIDLITKSSGKIYYWEIKGSLKDSFTLSTYQRMGIFYFVTTRLQNAMRWSGMSVRELRLAKDLLNDLQAKRGQIDGGIIFFRNLYSGSGSSVLFLPW